MTNLEYPCLCGHLLSKHHDNIHKRYFNVDFWCEECFEQTHRDRETNYHNFKGDNLKYLEEMSK